jgi:hypothetical protein
MTTLFTELPNCFLIRFQCPPAPEEWERAGLSGFSLGSIARHITSVKMRSARQPHNWEIAGQTRGKTLSEREGNSE